jgi:hypothetical protein
LQEPHNLGCLVSRYAARHSESNFHRFTKQRLRAFRVCRAFGTPESMP